MQLKTFLRTFDKKYASAEVVSPRFVLSHKHSDHDLFVRVARSIGRILCCEVVLVSLQDLEIDAWKSPFVSTFLGRRVLMALYSLPSSSSRAGSIKDFLARYQGPHYVFYVDDLFTGKKRNDNTTIITVPEKIGVQEVSEYESLFSTSVHILHRVVQAMGLVRPIINIEQLCRIDRYAACLPADLSDEQLCQLFGNMFEQRSLFRLAEAFLLRDGKAFGSLWVTVRDVFPVQFWLNYFSELVWAGYRYVHAKHAGQSIDGATERKLPFSFTRSNGWQRWGLGQLLQAHGLLMHTDTITKRGGQDDIMELMIHLFLANASTQQLVIQLQRYT